MGWDIGIYRFAAGDRGPRRFERSELVAVVCYQRDLALAVFDDPKVYRYDDAHESVLDNDGTFWPDLYFFPDWPALHAKLTAALADHPNRPYQELVEAIDKILALPPAAQDCYYMVIG